MTYPDEWPDMSDYVVHFTKATESADQYTNIMSILGSRVLKAGRTFGIARHTAPNSTSQEAVCFSEIPLHLLARIANKRGDYGLGFTKKFVTERSGGPIWYVEKGGPSHAALEQLIQQAHGTPADPIWKLTPFVDAPGVYATGKYRFEWEREWRCVGNFKFCEDNVAFVIIPEEFHAAAKDFFEMAVTDNLGPGYFCPYVDPRWTRAKVQHALTNL